MGDGIVFTLVRDGVEVWRAYGSDPGGLPDGGERVWVESVSGWMGQPGAARTEPRATLLTGGSLPMRRVGWDGRTITLTGWAEPPAGMTVDEWALAQPARLLPSDTGQHELVLYSTGHGVDVHAVVEPDGQPTWRPDHGTGLVEWQLPLHAPAVHLSGQVQRAQVFNSPEGLGLEWPILGDGYVDWGQAAADDYAQPLRNPGMVDAWPTVVLSGTALSGARITDGRGHWVVYRGACTWAAPVTVDFGAGTATGPGGADLTGLLTGRGFWRVPAGGAVTPTVVSPQAGTTVLADFSLTPLYL